MTHDAHMAVAAIHAAIGLTVLVLVWQYICLPSLRDGLRAKLFQVRRELFLYAAQGGIPFSDPAYVEMRASLNWYIRNAEKLNFGRIWLMVTIVGDTSSPDDVDLDDLIARTRPGEARAKLRSFREQEATAAAIYLLQTSPVAWIYVFACAFREGRKHFAPAPALAHKLPSKPGWDLCRT